MTLRTLWGIALLGLEIAVLVWPSSGTGLFLKKAGFSENPFDFFFLPILKGQ